MLRQKMTHFSNSGHTHSVCFRCAECFVGRVKPYTLRVQTFVQSFFARCVGRVRPYTHHVQPFVQTFDTRNDSLIVRRTGSPCTCVARHYSLHNVRPGGLFPFLARDDSLALKHAKFRAPDRHDSNNGHFTIVLRSFNVALAK